MSAAAAVISLVLLGSVAQLAQAQCPLKCRCMAVSHRPYVDCRDRNFEKPPTTGDDTYLEMNLSRNRLRHLGSYSFEKFPQLLILDLSYNFIVELHDGVFKGADRIEHLDLSNNSLVFVSPHFLESCPGIQFLSLARNEYIGKVIETETKKMVQSFLVAPSLRTLVLSECQITTFPQWIVSGLPGLSTLDISNNKIKVLPVISIVSVCRLMTINLENNPFNCEACANAVTKNYFIENKTKFDKNGTFCQRNVRQWCELNITQQVQEVRSKCLLTRIPDPLPRGQPRSLWVYIGGASIGLVALIFLAMLFNGLMSTCKRETSPPPSPGSPHSRAVQMELKEILGRPDNLYKNRPLQLD
ncbi:leucine-rich repeat-containing protein 38-like [Cloeon dipterum]|uniref:leucine-rich repeat-containing protein 38-like n=1 Tax=Cloeon dipterum TaxID=197152 RepID=UPI00322017E7